MQDQEIQQLLQAVADSDGETPELVETHLSWVILAAAEAFKIKKPVKFEFADFSTPERRRHFCNEELRLNGRLAPDLYRDVVDITQDDRGRFTFGGSGTVVDAAVRMQRFPSDCLVPRLLAAGRITPQQIDDLADRIAAFHERCAVAGADSEFGTAAGVIVPVRENFRTLRGLLHEPWKSVNERVAESVERQIPQLEARFDERHAGGAVRECHGDLHLGNMFLDRDHITVFDGIEFNAAFRWVDVISEVAFAVMDFDDRGRPDLGWRFLNRWLEATGDFDGVPLLPFYLCYRAMVRAKVAGLQAGQAESQRSRLQSLAGEFDEYLHLAQKYITRRDGAILITNGVSGTGKSRHTRPLVESLSAIRLRSDVVRKRLAGLQPDQHSGSELGEGLYSAAMSDRTYNELLTLTESTAAAGLPVVVDATFLRRQQRRRFRELARRLDVPFRILHFAAAPEMLERRIRRRLQNDSDASEATIDVLHRQLASEEPLDDEELADSVLFTDDESLHTEVRRGLRQHNARE